MKGKRLSSACLLAVLLVAAGLAFRAPAVLESLQFDEPFWMLRGDFLVHSLEAGDAEALQTRLWNIERMKDGRPVYRGWMGSGMVNALLTGLGRRAFTDPQSSPYAAIAASRALHALLSALTPLLLVWMGRRCGLQWHAALLFGCYLLVDPVIRRFGCIAHMESVLTLAIPGSLLLAEQGRRSRSWRTVAGAGVLFGIAFANRVNGAAAPLSLALFFALRWWLDSRRERARERGSARPHPGRRPNGPAGAMRYAAHLTLYGLAGAAAFVILFPPLWSDPLFGLLDFLRQYSDGKANGDLAAVVPASFPASILPAGILFALAALAGFLFREVRSHRLFQLGWTLYLVGCLLLSRGSAPPNSRYLSSLMPGIGLAGAIALAAMWRRWGPAWSRRTLVAAAAASLSFLSLALGWREWARFGQIREFYRELSAQRVTYVSAAPPAVEFRLEDTPISSLKVLHVHSQAWHVPLLYLGISTSNLRDRNETAPGWESRPLDSAEPCVPGDLWLSEYPPPPDVSLTDTRRLNALISGTCQ